MRGHDDATLVGAAREGDARAFEELMRRHGRAVRTTVRGHLRDPDTHDDAVQETFTRAFERIHTLRTPDRFRPWLLQIARNASSDVRRRRARATIESLDETGDDGVIPVAVEVAPDEQAEVRELVAMVRDGVAGLSPRDATALSMVMWFGFGPTEIGAALGLTPNAAKVMLHRARRRLRDALLTEVAAQGRCDTAAGLLDDPEADPERAIDHVRACAICTATAHDRFGTSEPLGA